MTPIEAPEPADPRTVVIEKTLESTVELYRNAHGKRMCTGTRVSPTRILSAYHCAVANALDDATLEMLDMIGVDLTQVEVEGLEGQTIKFETYAQALADAPADERGSSKVLYWDRSNDLLLLETPRSDQPSVRVADRPLRYGQEVFLIGHPLGQTYTYTHGYVSNPCRTWEDGVDPKTCWTQLDITGGPGSSGGGLYNNAGELVGVLSAGMNAIPLMYSAAPRAVAGFVALP